MKKLTYNLSIITLLFATSCSHSKQYSSCDSIAPALKDEHYRDLVKDWGEPYQKHYYGPNNEWLCKWHGVGINGTDATIHFEDITYSWGEHGPFTVRGTECEPDVKPTSIPVANSSLNTNGEPVTQSNIDIPKFISSFDNFLSDQPFLKSSRINVKTIKEYYSKSETTSRTHITTLFTKNIYPDILITGIEFGFDNTNPVFDMGNDNDGFPLSHCLNLRDSSNAILAEIKIQCNGVKPNLIAKSISELLAKKYGGVSEKYKSECASCSEDVNQAYEVNGKLFTFEVRYDDSSVVMTCSYKTDYQLSHLN